MRFFVRSLTNWLLIIINILQLRLLLSLGRCVIIVYDNLLIIVPNKAQIDEHYDDNHSDYNAPDEAFVSCALTRHFLLKLFVRHLDVFSGVAQLLIDLQ